MVLGVRVHGVTIKDVDVHIDQCFREVLVANRLGIPLLIKALPGTGGDDSHIRSSIIVRVLVDPDDGWAPMEWQYGGRRGPAPPVVLVRRDTVPFSAHDFGVMLAYMTEWLEEATESTESRAQVNEK